ncbi:reverse transcriptase domain-containing protein [Tanacetum coccineum]
MPGGFCPKELTCSTPNKPGLPSDQWFIASAHSNAAIPDITGLDPVKHPSESRKIPHLTRGARWQVQSKGGGGPEGQDDRETTPPPLTKEEIEGHVSALKSIIKDHNKRNKTNLILLDFEEDTAPKDNRIMKGKDVVDDDLRKPFKEALQTPLTRRIIEFAGPEYKMPANIKLYDGIADPKDHLSSINEWSELREAFASRYSVRRACFKEPHEITKIVRRDNESLTTFKERWTVERGFIMGVSKVMKISSFMNSLKCPELAKRLSNKAPTIVDEMMMRVDDFVRSKEAFARTELPKGETGEEHRKSFVYMGRKDDRPYKSNNVVEPQKYDNRNNQRGRDNYHSYRGRDNRAPYPPPRGEFLARTILVLTLEALTKPPKEIVATETQLRLPPPRPMANPFRGGNTNRYCNYHQEKGHYTNDYKKIKKQLKMALESGKLNHPVKDVRKRGRGNRRDEAPQPAKIINMIRVVPIEEKKRKSREATEEWMNIPITFPTVSSEDVSDELLIVEAEVKGYLVRRVYMDEGASVEVMEEDPVDKRSPGTEKVITTEEVMVNPTFPDQLVVIGGVLSEECKSELKHLLKENMEVFAWELSDIVGVPQRLIEHTLNVNTFVEPIVRLKPSWGLDTNVFLDAYKGYYQIQMSREDEKKTALYTDQGTYCYTKMPFGLKNARATYRILIDAAFQSQIRRNLEAYADEIVIKSSNKKALLADIAEMFDNLRKINMKLNQKKCSFGVEEGNFLGYMSLSGKLAGLNRFLAKSTERSLPFFNTLKNITKENKHEYKWTTEAEEAFQQMKKLILSLSSLTLTYPKETLYAYLAVSKEHKLAKYAIELGAYNITFEPRNAVKEVAHERDDTEVWTLYTDGASSTKGSGAEYEALLTGLRITKKMRIQALKAKVDSNLVASQIKGEYVAISDSVIKYLAKAKEYIADFKSFSIRNIPQNQNQKSRRTQQARLVHSGGRSTFQEGIPSANAEAPCCKPLERFGVPWIIVTDNGTHFVNDPFKSWCGRLNIQQMNMDVAHPQANGLVERENKSMMEGIKTRLGRERAGWVDKLPNVLCAHRTLIKQSNGETPFSLTYGSEAVISAKIDMPTYRTMMIREGFN